MSLCKIGAAQTTETKEDNSAQSHALVLGATEVSFGSVLHAFHIPFAGHILSWNQSFVLGLGLRAKERPGLFEPFQISCAASLLKSLSPAGKKLTPMLAISVQGLLFNFGSLILGRNLGGAILGGLLMSTWSFVQPVALYSVLFGTEIWSIWEKSLVHLAQSAGLEHFEILPVVIGLVAANALICATAAALGARLNPAYVRRWQAWLSDRAPKVTSKKLGPARTPAMAAARDLLNPFFLFSIILTVLYWKFGESAASPLIWVVLRPLAAGYIAFFAARKLPLQKWVALVTSRNRA